MAVITTSYFFQMKKNIKHEYEIVVKLYDTRLEMIGDFDQAKALYKDAEGIFVPARGNSKYCGSIRLAKDCLTLENIIHESAHAAIEVNRHIRKCRLAIHEENIVTSISQLASLLIKETMACIGGTK